MRLSCGAKLKVLILVASKPWFEILLNYLHLIILTHRGAQEMSYQARKEYLAEC